MVVYVSCMFGVLGMLCWVISGCWFCFDLVPILPGALLVDYCVIYIVVVGGLFHPFDSGGRVGYFTALLL